MKTNSPTNPTPPAGYPLCVSQTCPRRTDCLHAMVAKQQLTEEPVTIVINPYHPDYREGEACNYYRSTKPERYARGFKSGLSELPVKSYSTCTRHLIALSSKSQYYRQRSGEEPLSPEKQQEILYILRHYGYQGKDTDAFDTYEERYSW